MPKFTGSQKAAITLQLMEAAVNWCKANGIKAAINDGVIGLAKKVSGKTCGIANRRVALGMLMKFAKQPRQVQAAEREGFYSSQEWLELRYKALKNSQGLCECCGRGRKDGTILHVDHIKPRSKFPHLGLSLENLQVLCRECNFGKSNKDSTDWRDKPSGNVVLMKVYQKAR